MLAHVLPKCCELGTTSMTSTPFPEILKGKTGGDLLNKTGRVEWGSPGSRVECKASSATN